MIYIGIQNDPGMEHHGIKGQKWGVRRFQNEDGTLTPEGKKRYEKDSINQFQSIINKQENNYQRKTDRIIRAKSETDKMLESWGIDVGLYGKGSKEFDSYVDLILNANYNKLLTSDVLSDKQYKEVELRIKQYGLEDSEKFIKAWMNRPV